MNKLKLQSLFAASVAAYAIMLPAAAQQPGNDAPPPPQLENLEEGEEPAVTIRKQDEQQGRIEEKRGAGGRVEEVKVTTGGSTYYLRPNSTAGSALPGDAQSSGNRAAQWEIKTFDTRPQQEAKEADAAQELPAAPPPEQK